MFVGVLATNLSVQGRNVSNRLDHFIDCLAQALAVAPPSDESQKVAQTAKTPIVNGCEYSPGLAVSSAHIDNERAAGEAMDHLYGLGHTRVGVITGPLARAT